MRNTAKIEFHSENRQFQVEYTRLELNRAEKVSVPNGQQPHGGRYRGCGSRCGGEQKVNEKS